MDKEKMSPKYKQIKEDIVEDILSGVYESGDMIPKQSEYAEHYKVSRLTVRKAIDDLVKKGILQTEKGKGTFVQDIATKAYSYRRIAGLSSNIVSKKVKLKSRVVSIEEIEADKSLASHLDIEEGDHQLCELEWNNLAVQKILFIDPAKPGRMDTLIDMAKDVKDVISIVRYSDRSLDVMPAGCNKESGIKRLAEIMDLELKNIAAVGDNENDINMLKEVGFGAAVGNAVESLKQVADYCCENEAAGGVDEVLRKLFT